MACVCVKTLHEYGLYSSCIVHTVRISYISTAHTMWMLCYPGSTHMGKLRTSYGIISSTFSSWCLFHHNTFCLLLFFRSSSYGCDSLGDYESHVCRHRVSDVHIKYKHHSGYLKGYLTVMQTYKVHQWFYFADQMVSVSSLLHLSVWIF